MKILLLSDLHANRTWYRWLSGHHADLTAIAGDLIDGFHPEGLLPQIIALKKWADGFHGVLALSSGNHDGNLEAAAVRRELVAAESDSAHVILGQNRWMDALERPGVVTDRRSQLIGTPSGQIVVTTIPFYPGPQGPRFCNELWETGHHLRATTGAPWLVLHHEPPADTLVGGRTGDPALFYKIRECQPDFVLSGHIHSQPYEGNFADRIDRTWCFNPGFPYYKKLAEAKKPNHIWIDTHARTATWHAAPLLGREPITKQISLT